MSDHVAVPKGHDIVAAGRYARGRGGTRVASEPDRDSLDGGGPGASGLGRRRRGSPAPRCWSVTEAAVRRYLLASLRDVDGADDLRKTSR